MGCLVAREASFSEALTGDDAASAEEPAPARGAGDSAVTDTELLASVSLPLNPEALCLLSSLQVIKS